MIRGFVLLHLCAHFQVNGVCRACTWASVTQSKEHRALGLLGVQEQNPLNPAPQSLQPIQLQFCSQVCAEEKADVRACLDPFMPGSPIFRSKVPFGRNRRVGSSAHLQKRGSPLRSRMHTRPLSGCRKTRLRSRMRQHYTLAHQK